VHYEAAGFEIRTENAAKPVSQPSTYLRDWLLSHLAVSEALDYGCGKLRYTGYLAKVAGFVAVVDSEIQLSRVQTIAGLQTSIREFVARRWPNVRAYNVSEFSRVAPRFELALCANVLSAIPQKGPRIEAIRVVASHLNQAGVGLFTVQSRNSYFKAWASDPKARRYGDGWLVPSDGRASFYGIITRPKLERLVSEAGMHVVKSWVHGESSYVLAAGRSRVITSPNFVERRRVAAPACGDRFTRPAKSAPSRQVKEQRRGPGRDQFDERFIDR